MAARVHDFCVIGGGIVGLLAVIAGFAVHEWWLR